MQAKTLGKTLISATAVAQMTELENAPTSGDHHLTWRKCP